MGVGGYRQINKALNICAFEDYLEIQQARLPELANVEQLSPRVIRVLGQNPGQVRYGNHITNRSRGMLTGGTISLPYKGQTPILLVLGPRG